MKDDNDTLKQGCTIPGRRVVRQTKFYGGV